MQNAMNTTEKAYSTSEIAAMLDMGVTTVRKYAQHMEKSGYKFFKNKNNARLFVDRDIVAIRYLKELRDKTNITVEQATKIVMEKVSTEETNEIETANTPSLVEPMDKNNSANHEEIIRLIRNQNELIHGLMERLDKQQEVINEWLSERDKELMRTITERLETQRLIAAASEEEEKFKQRKTFFQWLFRR
ncbi:MerR family transcriptional regulator [Oceanobacillus senegalensis]|uniref:MerR family transcriptional regulator n=1 Tax=Oceanobacillus senegalensis TaxID=1936063 RepID=UPI000A308C3F|nr:MerR family transcriptional regulator [Oceanobacillus senegalensis]